ncbi:hypothetical protein NtRootA1_01690 [Arthrobacter sp. NtRootA1]|nr:hypothetical protein NtRootA1_01690 [Arthrobacter sp. NtRootA1]
MVVKPKRNSVKPGLSSSRSCNCSAVGTASFWAISASFQATPERLTPAGGNALEFAHSPDIQLRTYLATPEISYYRHYA